MIYIMLINKNKNINKFSKSKNNDHKILLYHDFKYLAYF